MKGITQKQQAILDAIRAFINKEGMSPTVYELADLFNIKISTIFAHLKALQKKGLITRTNKARSIKPCDMTNTINLTATREGVFIGRAFVANQNHAEFMSHAFRTMGATEINVESTVSN